MNTDDLLVAILEFGIINARMNLQIIASTTRNMDVFEQWKKPCEDMQAVYTEVVRNREDLTHLEI